MERQILLRFHGDDPCSHQGIAKRTEAEALFSCGHSNPYLDIDQCSHMDFPIVQNMQMAKSIKEIMAERLTYLMRVTPAFDTLQKIATRSKVSYGTVRRIKTAAEVDASISNIEKVAACFNLSLIEFISQPGEPGGLDAEETVLIQKFRSLNSKDRTEVLFFASSKAAINQVMSNQPPTDDKT